MKSRLSAGPPKGLRSELLRWFDANKRPMPWRETNDPYAIWLSETMLQQTRVETVIPYYERFLESFPTIGALATGDREAVLEHWAGLGYYSRARNLHEGAKQVAERHAGQVPADRESLLALSGVGRYTAGAVASIAFDRPEAVVDGNVARVFSRFFGIREDIRRSGVQKRLWAEAERWVAGPRPGDFNQALMELGAVLCTPRDPQCRTCPLAKSCDAHATGDAASLPIKTPKSKPRKVRAACVWLVRRGRALVVQRPSEGLLGGMWDLPGAELGPEADAAQGLAQNVEERLGLSLEGLQPLGEVEHVFTHRHLLLHVFSAHGASGRIRRRGYEDHRWLTPDRVAQLGVASVTRKALELVCSAGEPIKKGAEPRRDARGTLGFSRSTLHPSDGGQ